MDDGEFSNIPAAAARLTSNEPLIRQTRRAAFMPAFWVSAAGVGLVAFTMRQAVASVPPVLINLGLSETAQSLLVALPVLCFSAGALAGPALRARLGEERAIFALAGLLLVGLLLRSAWPALALFPGTLFAGLAVATLNVLLPSLVKRRFAGRVGAMMASYTVMMTLGSALAAGLTVPVLHAAHGSINVALGVWAIPVALALVVWLPQSRAGPASARVAGAPRPSAIWRRLLAWQLLVYMGLGSLFFYGELSWIPAIYRDRGLDATSAGILLLALNVFGIVGNLVAPLLAVRMRDQRPAVTAIVTLTCLGVLGMLLGPTSAALLWMIVLGVAQGAQLSLTLTMIVLRSSDGDTAARLSSMSQSGAYLLATLGPLTMGLLHAVTGGWSAPLVFLLAAVAASWPLGMAAARNRVIGAAEPA